MDIDSDYSDNDFDYHDSDSDEFVLESTKKKTSTTKGKGKTTKSSSTKASSTKASSTKASTTKSASKTNSIKSTRGRGKAKAKESRQEVCASPEPMSDVESTTNNETSTATPINPENSYPITQVQSKKSVTEIYQKKTQLEHILLRPDTYIGSVEFISSPMWVFNKNTKNFEYRTITIVPGLYKIFDEILVNAADNKIRDPSMDTIKVTIDSEKNEISVFNNGKGIPVEIHEKEKVYIPELIFGHLLTSSNYDDNEKKVTGGRNGYGAKLCNIFSTEFIVETSDKHAGKKFKQIFNDNMSKKSKPKLTNATKDDFTKITFKPDLKKFGMEKMDEDFEALLLKRVYDIAGCVSGVKVYLNDERIKIKNFKDYCQMYINSTKKESEENDLGSMPNQNQNIIYERVNERWEVAFSMSDGQFQQVSFVNSICTVKGGTHVSYVADQITSKLIDSLKKKNKNLSIKPFQVRNHLWVFINSLIENPAFDSQTKETLTLRASSFGSKCPVSDNFINKVLRSGVVDNILSWAKYKQSQMLKKTDGHKRSRISGIPKLDDANNAGTKHSKDCVLILTEGDSAKALAISGLTIVGRDNYGVFPLRGKMLNVRDASHKSIMDNAEVSAIKQILGLQHGKVYTNTDSLRYGHIMIMTDQDTDGSHIKGLVINFLDHFWPSLLKIPGFLLEFITPIVKVSRKGRASISFYTLPEYERWKEDNNDGKGWKIKYYKGLGTSTAAEAKEYFSDMQHHCKKFSEIEPDDRKLLDMAFSKKNADKRKDWLKEYTPDIYMDNSVDKIVINEFINKELIQFSMADVIRSIPSLVDGFKPGQRKIMYGCFKRNLTNEIKVAQLTGYIAEHTAYHHGEQSLSLAIVNLAQDFVGSNNINLLVPNGQFGTRLQGGKDAASARYIFTQLAKVTRLIFKKSDDNILEYLNDDGQMIEPKWYIPILPMVLINGAEGIGTGYSTNIPNFNPRDVVMNLKRRIRGLDFIPMHPWYRGFRGKIELIDEGKYKVSGDIRKVDETTIEITELPIRTWTQNCKELLESYMTGTEKQPPIIKDYKEYHTDTSVHFRIFVSESMMKKLEEEGLEKKFKISNVINLSNMHLFDPQGRIKKYNKVEDIMEEFYNLRKDMYQKRKDYLIQEFDNELLILNNKVRFIMEILSGELVINRKKRADLVKEMIAKGYDRVFPKKKNSESSTPEEGKDESEDEGKGFEYLLSMQFWSLTYEKVEKLMAERDAKKEELDSLKAQTIEDLWLNDLDDFLDEWDKLEHEFDSLPRTTFGTTGNKEKPKRRSRKSTKVKTEDDDSASVSNSTSMQTSTNANSEDDYTPPTKTTRKRSSSKSKSVQSKLSFGSVKKEDDQDSNLLTKTSSLSSLSTLNNDLSTVKLEDSNENSTTSLSSTSKKGTRKLKRIKLEEEDSTFKKPDNGNTLTNWLNSSTTSSTNKMFDSMDIDAISSVKKEMDDNASISSKASSRRSSKKRKLDDDDDDSFMDDNDENDDDDVNNDPIKSPILRRLRTSSRSKKAPKYTFDDDDEDDDDDTLNDVDDNKDSDFGDLPLPELKSNKNNKDDKNDKNEISAISLSSNNDEKSDKKGDSTDDEITKIKDDNLNVEIIDIDKGRDIEMMLQKIKVKTKDVVIDDKNKDDDIQLIKDDDDLSIQTISSSSTAKPNETKSSPKKEPISLSRISAMKTKKKSKSEDIEKGEEPVKATSRTSRARASRTTSKRRAKARDIQYLELSDDD